MFFLILNPHIICYICNHLKYQYSKFIIGACKGHRLFFSIFHFPHAESSSSDDTITESESNGEESDHEAGDEPERERKKRKLAYKDPGMEGKTSEDLLKKKVKLKSEPKSPTQVNQKRSRRDSTALNESRRSSRRHTTEQRYKNSSQLINLFHYIN